MNTFIKVGLGFVLGIVSTILVLVIIGRSRNTEENQLREEIRLQALRDLKKTLGESDPDINPQSFELSTQRGIVELYTSMSKDSVKLLMGRPQATDIREGFRGNVEEIWKYKGSNNYIEEFTIEFTNGKLKSVSQFKEH